MTEKNTSSLNCGDELIAELLTFFSKNRLEASRSNNFVLFGHTFALTVIYTGSYNSNSSESTVCQRLRIQNYR